MPYFATVTQTPLQQGQQLLVVLHEPKEAAALARAIKQEVRIERAGDQSEYISECSLMLTQFSLVFQAVFTCGQGVFTDV